MLNREERLFNTETEKAQDLGQTLRRFWAYFRRYGLILLAVAGLIIAGTYMQVLIPDLTGQAVDCYLGPYAAQQFGGGDSPFANIPGLAAGTAQETNAFSNCWYTTPQFGATAAETIAGLAGLTK